MEIAFLRSGEHTVPSPRQLPAMARARGGDVHSVGCVPAAVCVRSLSLSLLLLLLLLSTSPTLSLLLCFSSDSPRLHAPKLNRTQPTAQCIRASVGGVGGAFGAHRCCITALNWIINFKWDLSQRAAFVCSAGRALMTCAVCLSCNCKPLS